MYSIYLRLMHKYPILECGKYCKAVDVPLTFDTQTMLIQELPMETMNSKQLSMNEQNEKNKKIKITHKTMIGGKKQIKMKAQQLLDEEPSINEESGWYEGNTNLFFVFFCEFVKKI